MKITRRQLRMLIREELNEGRLDAKSIAAAGAGVVGLAGVAVTPGALPALAAAGGAAYGLSKLLVPVTHDVMKQMLKYDRMKRQSSMPDSDKYWHFMAFGYGTKMLLEAGWKPRLAKAFMYTVGEVKEALDFVNPFSVTTGNWGEWANDMKANKAGIDAALRGEGCDAALEYAYNNGTWTTEELRSKSANWKKLIDVEYGWALDKYPELYGPYKSFIQPQYHCALSPSDRAQAYNHMKVTPVNGVEGPLRS